MNAQFLSQLGQPAHIPAGPVGREIWELWATGPASYNLTTGDPVNMPATGEYMSACPPATTVSGNYQVLFVPSTTNNTRVSWVARWFTTGLGAVTSVTQNVAGSGMTPGTVVPIVFSGGTGGGAAGTVTVLTATTISITITAGGSYTSAPTATVSGTGGTPPTLTVGAITTTVGQAASGANLSAETIQFAAIGGQV